MRLFSSLEDSVQLTIGPGFQGEVLVKVYAAGVNPGRVTADFQKPGQKCQPVVRNSALLRGVISFFENRLKSAHPYGFRRFVAFQSFMRFSKIYKV